MPKLLIFKFLVILFFIFGLSSSVFSQQPEELTITTYYPSPFGSYRELHTDQMAVGSGYRNTVPPDNSLIVEGNAGIGMAVPGVRLDVNGDIRTNAGITLGGIRRTSWPTEIRIDQDGSCVEIAGSCGAACPAGTVIRVITTGAPCGSPEAATFPTRIRCCRVRIHVPSE